MNIKDLYDGNFWKGGLYYMAGFFPEDSSKINWSGWGSDWVDTNRIIGSKAIGLTKTSNQLSKVGVLGSLGRVTIMGPLVLVAPSAIDFVSGLSSGDKSKMGLASISGLSWLGAELFSSSVIASSASPGAASAGALIGLLFGGPVGYAGGSAIGSYFGGMGLVSGGLGVAGIAGIAGLAALTTATAYTGARGSYEVLKAGYGHRQRMLRKIDTAGSTAAYMTRNSFTMRSQAVEAIRQNHLNARSAIGNEANLLHFSSYKKYSTGLQY